MKKFFLFLSIITITLSTVCQNINQRIKTENSFAVLKNANELIPLTRLDTLNIIIPQNTEKQIILKHSLERYLGFKSNKKSKLFIYPVFNKTDLKKIPSENTILCIFGKNIPLNKNFINKKNILTVIYTPINDSLTIDYCGQLIMGAFGAKSKKNLRINGMEQGSSIATKGGIRLKYTIPAELGLDSAFIFSKIDSIVNRAIKLKSMPGCQILAAKDQKVFFCKTYGYKTYDSIEKITNTNLYDLASITKIAATAPCMMKAYDQKKFNLTDPIYRYFRKFRHSNKQNITFLDAMCHQARLKPWIPFWKFTLNKDKELSKKFYRHRKTFVYKVQVAKNLYTKKRTKKLIFQQIKKSDLLPSKHYKYSDLSFYIYPEIIKKFYHQDISQCLNNYFYRKLGTKLCYKPLNYNKLENIVPTENDTIFRKQILQGYVDDEGAALLGGISGHAGLFGNEYALATLMQMYLNYGKYGGQKYIDSSTIVKWTSRQFPANRRGIIFDKTLLKNKEIGTPAPDASDKSFGHSGFTGTFTWADPENGLLFVFLSNRIYPYRSYKNLLKYNIRPSIHQILYKAIKKAQKQNN